MYLQHHCPQHWLAQQHQPGRAFVGLCALPSEHPSPSGQALPGCDVAPWEGPVRYGETPLQHTRQCMCSFYLQASSKSRTFSINVDGLRFQVSYLDLEALLELVRIGGQVFDGDDLLVVGLYVSLYTHMTLGPVFEIRAFWTKLQTALAIVYVLWWLNDMSCFVLSSI